MSKRFEIKKINDHNKSQSRVIEIDFKGIYAMKKNTIKRFVKHRDIKGNYQQVLKQLNL